MTDDTLDLARSLAGAAPLERDPRPGTRDLSQTALGVLGIELLRCDEQLVAARMPSSGGSQARGPLLVLAETVASTAAGRAAGDGRRAFGAELNASWCAPAAPGPVIAVASPLAIDATLQVWRIVVVDVAGTQVLEGRCSLGVVDAPT